MRKWLLLPIGGILLTLSTPPFLIFPLSLFSFVPLLMFKNDNKPILNAFAFIFPYHLFHLYWLIYLEAGRALGILFFLGVLLLIVVKSLAFSIWFYIARRFNGAFLFALSFVLYEKLLSLMGDLSFPWAFISYASLGFLPFAQISSILGMYFITFVIVFINYSIYEFFSFGRWRNLVISVISFILISAYGFIYMNHGEKFKSFINIAIVQPNVLPRFAYDPKELRETREALNEIAQLLKNEQFDLVVFSESALPGLVNSFHTMMLLKEFMRKTGKPVLIGIARKDTYYYNTAFLIDTSYRILGFYDKVKIVPFGENLPFYEYLPDFIRNLNLGQGNYHRGRNVKPLLFGNTSIGVLICYESIFPEISSEHVKSGANLLAVITNDGWFGPTTGPMEHFHYARMRAIETHRYIVRSAKTGISAVIDAHGRILDEIPLFERDVIVMKLPLLEDRTIYTYIGDSWIWIMLTLALLYNFILTKLPR